MLGRHHVIGAAERLAGDDGDQRHGGLAIGEQQLGAVLDQPAIFLRCAGQEAGDVDKGHDRNLERITEPHETGRLARGVGVEHAGQHHGLVGDETDGAALHAAEAGDDVAGEALLDLEEITLVSDFADQFLHVVGLVRIVGNEGVERGIHPFRLVEGRPFRHAGLVVEGKEVDQPAHLQQAFDIVLERAVRDRGFGGVHLGAAELFGGHGLVGDGLHHVRPGDEHVGGTMKMKSVMAGE